MKKISFLFLALLFLNACFKEENPRQANVSGYATLAIGNNYENQLFYSLADTHIVSSNSYKVWDIGFYSGDDESFIRLNSASNFYVIKTGSTDFNASYDLEAYSEEERRFDGTNYFNKDLALDSKLPTGYSADSLLTNKEVYLISGGLDASGNTIITPKKLVFEGIYKNSYIIRYADINGNNTKRKVIPRDETLNLTAFSFSEEQTVIVEPDKNTWDLLFTRNTDTVFATDGSYYLTGYAVTGAYLNINSVEAYLEEEISFNDINTSNIDESRLSKRLNTIGHYWKRFDSQYSIFSNKSYIIKDRNGFLFKIRFLSFYDEESGQKGYPSFEIEQLQ